MLIFWLLYCLPLLSKVLQRSGSCCCCYSVYHCCLMFDRGVVHVVAGYIVYHFRLRFDRGVVHVVVILSTFTVLGLKEKWLMLLLLYCIPLLFKVWQRSGSCCCWLYCPPFVFKVWQGNGCCCCYIVYHYCFRFDRGVAHVVVVVIFSTIIV